MRKPWFCKMTEALGVATGSMANHAEVDQSAYREFLHACKERIAAGLGMYKSTSYFMFFPLVLFLVLPCTTSAQSLLFTANDPYCLSDFPVCILSADFPEWTDYNIYPVVP